MRDVELYQQILGLSSPWGVERIELDAEAQRVVVFVSHGEDVSWRCPQCEADCGTYDHSEERTWRHLDTCQFQTFLLARVPRVNCPEHGVVQVSIPWAEPRGRFTMLFERFAIQVLLQCQTTMGACRLLGISWDEAQAIRDRAVKRGQSRKEATVVPRVGVDEKAFKRGHSYMTVVCNIDQGTVEFVAEERTKESLQGYFEGLTEEQRKGIKAVAMDMWEPYLQAALENLPWASGKIVFDRFHIMQHMSKAVDDVRKQEHRSLLQDGDKTLSGTKYLFLKGQEKLSEQARERMDSLPLSHLKTGRAWAIKESLRDLWHHATPTAAKAYFDRWYSWAIRSRLEPVKEVARMLLRRIDNVVSYCRHGITNAVAEGLNSKIMSLKRRASGFRNADSFKTAIYFYCGGLDMDPR
jgi:transposase